MARARILLVVPLLLVLLPSPAGATTGGTVELVHPAVVGTIRGSSASQDGRRVAFVTALALDAGDTDGVDDIYFYDRDTETVEWVSHNAGTGLDGFAFSPAISGDGETVAFVSTGTAVIPGDTNGEWDAFAWHHATGVNELVSVDTGGGWADGSSSYVAIDRAGDSVAFMSEASDLVAGDTNGGMDIFVRELAGDTTERVSLRSDDAEITIGDNSVRPEISADGRIVSFWSQGAVTTPGAPAAAQLYVRDRDAGTTVLASPNLGGDPSVAAPYGEHALSADGSTVAFHSTADDLVAGDAVAGIEEAYVWDRDSGEVSRVASLPGGGQPTSKVTLLGISADGDQVLVQTVATLSTADTDGGSKDVYVVRRSTGQAYVASFRENGTEPVSTPDTPDGQVIDDLGRVIHANAADLGGTGTSFFRLWETVPCTWAPTAFSDVAPSHPFACDIAWSVGRDVSGGYSDGTFRPGAPVTRQAMAAFLFGLLDGGPSADPGFPDVGPTHPFHDEIAWLASSGIAAGFSDGTFRPAAPVSRQAMAAFLYRAAGSPEGDDPGCNDAPFPDVPASHQFCGEIAWMVAAGITTGYDDGTFRPTDTVTRQAMVAFLQRLRSYVLF